MSTAGSSRPIDSNNKNVMKIERNPALLRAMFEALDVPDEMIQVLNTGETVKFRCLEKTSSQFDSLKDTFESHVKNDQLLNFTIESVVEVLNPFIFAQYALKVKKKQQLNKETTQATLFHGTHSSAIIPICKYNFDWRKVKTHRFGHGLSFAKHVSYASHYPTDEISRLRTIILANVIIAGKCKGNRDVVIPPADCDTSVNDNEDVVVKYEDADFYPTHVFHYIKNKEDRISEKVRRAEEFWQPCDLETDCLFDKISLIDENDPNIVVVDP